MAKDRPLVLLSWLALLAFEDLPEFSDLPGVPAEHLLQSLLYRLRECGVEASDGVQETVKVVTPFKIAPFHPPSDSLCGSLPPSRRVSWHASCSEPTGECWWSVSPMRWVLFSL